MIAENGNLKISPATCLERREMCNLSIARMELARMSGELGRYWWSSVWARILRRGGGPAVDQIDSTGAEILELAAAWPLMPCIFDPATPLDALT